MRFLIDTNILLYAANRDCPEHRAAKFFLEDVLKRAVPWALSWNIVYEFLRVATHPRVFMRPLSAEEGLSFLSALTQSPALTLLGSTPNHELRLQETVRELSAPMGNLFHDIHTAVLLREHGIQDLYTADTDFLQFSSLNVVNPVKEAMLPTEKK